ncbi:MAG: hypothetical protein Fur0032_19950 [Terrimicrobiaceae bacterium]
MQSWGTADVLKRLAGSLPPEPGGLCEEAHPVACALLAGSLRRLWVLCPEVRTQEELATELAEWCPLTRVFPEIPSSQGDVLADPETTAERLDILMRLADPGWEGIVVLNESQWNEDVPEPGELESAALSLECGKQLDRDDLVAGLERFGYEKVGTAAVRGQYAVRGGLVDLFSWHAERPLRVEFDDLLIASLRVFDPDTQISVASVESARVYPPANARRFIPLNSLRQPGDAVILVNGASGPGDAVPLGGASTGDDGGFFPPPFSDLAAGDLVMNALRAERFFAQLEEWRLGGWEVALAAGSESEASRFQEFAAERGRDVSWMRHLPVALSHGFLHQPSRTAILAEAAVFGRSALLRARRLGARRFRAAATRAASDFSQFEEGDYVVHLEHGIGRFEGFVEPPDGQGGEVLAIAYANDARVYVPVTQAWQVSRYAGLGRATPPLSDLGSDRWAKAKEKAVDSVFEYAARMLRIQAERQSLPGHAFGPDTHWQSEFEGSFPYRETNDQIRAIADTKRDMEATRPMDRLICGDVGFGKTEVAIRAIFKAVMEGKQAAFLAPTTVLAHQHYQNLRERFSDFPITVGLLSRHRSPSQQRKVLKGISDGSIDVAVGTHRLISADVVFRDPGLVVVDEEQRFGVRHKDLLKERFRQVDVLTLSATPIPRTLYLALVGSRDMSLIETPPPNRQPVETIVCAYDERVFRDAIRREIERGGQVYFLHNRVATIEKVAARITQLCPGAKVVVGHGQMPEGELDIVMETFVTGRADVLVSTTIIESGLDIPNANTIIIDRADRFGLADLYQLRGRVGRSGVKAYAYLMLPRDLMGAARKRVSAIKQYSELGSGFKIAMRDLELRGAGNLLGTAQSGHILAVGFDLYCRMLKRAVDALGGKARFSRAECAVRLDFVRTEENAALAAAGLVDACIPASYIPDSLVRIACYRELAEAEDHAAVDAMESRWRDRFGPLPEPVVLLVLLTRISIAGAARRFRSIEARDSRLMIEQKSGFVQVDGKFPRLTENEPASRLREVLRLVEQISAR